MHVSVTEFSEDVSAAAGKLRAIFQTGIAFSRLRGAGSSRHGGAGEADAAVAAAAAALASTSTAAGGAGGDAGMQAEAGGVGDDVAVAYPGSPGAVPSVDGGASAAFAGSDANPAAIARVTGGHRGRGQSFRMRRGVGGGGGVRVDSSANP
jgi:hypothetical protein